MLADTDIHNVAASLFQEHGERAAGYALRNARRLQFQDAELEHIWLRVARQAEKLIAVASNGRRVSDA